MEEHDRRVIFSGRRGDWETPDFLFVALNTEFQFTVDAAANAQNALCSAWYGPGGTREDALDGRLWEGRVFCNPPYGRDVERWCATAVRSVVENRVARIRAYETEIADVVVLLLPARTDTKWFHTWLVPHAEIRFLKGRLRFGLEGQVMDPAPFPSMIAVIRYPPMHWAVMR